MPQSQTSLLGPLALAAVAVVVLASGWYFESRARSHDASRFEARLARLERGTPPAPEAAWAASASRSYPPTLRRPSVDSATSAGLRGPGAPPVLSADEQARLQRQATGRLESRFAADGNDPSWAFATEDQVAKAAADPALAQFKPPAGSDVHCARSMCRLVFTFDSADAAEDWLTYYPAGLARQLPVFSNVSVRLPDGRAELRMYGFRDPRARPPG